MRLPASAFDNVAIGGLDACWLWRGATQRRGYGSTRYKGRTVRAHRMFYEVLHGPIPAGYVLHHICEEKRCVNPRHLEPLTAREHMEAHGFKASEATSRRFREQTHCVHGHEYTPENLYWGVHGRQCRACNRIAAYERYHRRKAERAATEKPGEGAGA